MVPVTLPFEDVEVAVQTGELDGIAWSGITEDYTVGWADVTNYFLTNNISGAWCGSYFANSEKWAALPRTPAGTVPPEHGQLPLLPPALVLGRRGQAARQRQEAGAHVDSRRRVAQVEAQARDFWNEIAAESPRNARVVKILRDYNAAMDQAGRPYRYS